MRSYFEVVRKVRDWLRSEIKDSEIRLYRTQLEIVLSLIFLIQERMPITRQEIIRATSLSVSSVHRGLSALIKLGVVRQNDKTYEFAVEVPRDILEISTGDGNVTMALLDDLKRFIVAELPQAGVPADKIPQISDAISEYTPPPVAERKGTKKRLGDALL